MDQQHFFFAGFAAALGFELQEDANLIGRSGQLHRFSGLAIDEPGQRMLVLSDKIDPRAAALVHADAAANVRGYRLITARALHFDLGLLARAINAAEPDPGGDAAASAATTALQMRTRQRTAAVMDDDSLSDGLTNLRKGFDAAGLALGPLLNAPALSGVDPRDRLRLLLKQVDMLKEKGLIGIQSPGSTEPVDLSDMPDAQYWDRQFGLCTVPLFELSEADWDTFNTGIDSEAIRLRLLDMGVTQYFHPPRDHAVLTLVERGTGTATGLASAIEKLDRIGHPPASDEFLDVDPRDSLNDVLERLRGLGHIADDERGLMVTESGRGIRSAVKFRPRESVFTKLLNPIGVVARRG
jgi:hypothetical protein